MSASDDDWTKQQDDHESDHAEQHVDTPKKETKGGRHHSKEHTKRATSPVKPKTTRKQPAPRTPAQKRRAPAETRTENKEEKRKKQEKTKETPEKEETKKDKKQGKKKPGENMKEKKKKKKQATPDTDESSDNISSEESSSSSSDSSSESTSSASSEDSLGGHKTAKKKRSGKSVDLDLLEELWATEERPKKLQSKSGLKGYTIPKLMKLKEQFVKESERKGLGTAIYGKDQKPKKKKYKKMTDDGELRLHPARFDGLPLSTPSKYWDKVPACKTEIFRHIPLQHLGVKSVPELTIVKMHNRRAPIELGMLRKEVSEVRHVQEAVFNYVAVLRSLHPMDHAGLVIQKVLIDADWCRHIGSDDKQRVKIMQQFFDEAAKDNSGRALRREPPLDAEQVNN